MEELGWYMYILNIWMSNRQEEGEENWVKTIWNNLTAVIKMF